MQTFFSYLDTAFSRYCNFIDAVITDWHRKGYFEGKKLLRFWNLGYRTVLMSNSDWRYWRFGHTVLCEILRFWDIWLCIHVTQTFDNGYLSICHMLRITTTAFVNLVSSCTRAEDRFMMPSYCPHWFLELYLCLTDMQRSHDIDLKVPFEMWHFRRSEIYIDYRQIQCIIVFLSSLLPILKFNLQVLWINSSTIQSIDFHPPGTIQRH